MSDQWEATQGPGLQQGDWLTDCPVPIFSAALASVKSGEVGEVELAPADVVVVTQSCDLEVHGGDRPKARLVAVCAVYWLARWIEFNPAFKDANLKEKARRGEVEGLHLIASPTAPEDNQQVLVVCFRELYSLPYPFISAHATMASNRWRLRSPYLEHLSQGFARFFMRVGLPSGISSYVPTKPR